MKRQEKQASAHMAYILSLCRYPNRSRPQLQLCIRAVPTISETEAAAQSQVRTSRTRDWQAAKQASPEEESAIIGADPRERCLRKLVVFSKVL